MASKAICIIGARGMLGTELVRACSRAAGGPGAASSSAEPHEVHALDLEQIDITDAARVDEAIDQLRPRLVINAAAYTDVDGCEANPSLAEAVNGAAPGHLAQACRRVGAWLIHVSTDYVFDGRQATPYEPDDPVNPLGVYGRTKAEGERRVRENLAKHVIVRTSWLFAPHGRNFVRTIYRAAREREELRVVADQTGCPTYAPDLAAALVALGTSGLTGTYHFTNAGSCTWHAFAEAIVRQAGLPTRVVPIRTAELGRPAPRPAYSVLSTRRLMREAGIVPRGWPEALAECMQALQQGETES